MNKFSKLLIYLIFFSTLVSATFAYTVTNNLPYDIKYREVNSIANPTAFIGPEQILYSYDNVALNGNYFYYSDSDELAYFSSGAGSSSAIIVEDHYDSLFSNFPPSSFNWLSSASCILSRSGSTIYANFVNNGQVAAYRTFLQGNAPQVLDKNYNMKVAITYELKNPNGTYVDSRTTTDSVIPYEGFTITGTPFSQIDADSAAPSYGYGTYYVEVTNVEPIDYKCDFNDDGDYSDNSIPLSAVPIPTSEAFITSSPDDDGDGVPNGPDLCPTTPSGPVNAAGCAWSEVDYDYDFVCDVPEGPETATHCTGDDLCPASSGSVNAAGCEQSQVDFDQDGVCDDPEGPRTLGLCTGSDICSGTPFGENVSTVGCAAFDVDYDFDGVCNQGKTAEGVGICTGNDKCEYTPGNITFNGCSHEFTEVSCGGALSFNLAAQNMFCSGGNDNDMSYRFDPAGNIGEYGSFVSSGQYGYNLASNGVASDGVYNCFEEQIVDYIWIFPIFDDVHVGHCDVQYNGGGGGGTNDADSDGILDAVDLCPVDAGVGAYRGCPTEFSLIGNGCSNSTIANFNEATGDFSCNLQGNLCNQYAFNGDYASLPGTIFNGFTSSVNVGSTFGSGASGHYQCIVAMDKQISGGSDPVYCGDFYGTNYPQVAATCEVRDNKAAAPTSFCTIDGVTVSEGTSIDLYSTKFVYEDDTFDCDYYKFSRTCTNGGFSGLSSSDYLNNYASCFELDDDYEGVYINLSDPNRIIAEENDDHSFYKNIVDLKNNQTFFLNESGEEEILEIPEVDDTKKIDIYRNGVLIRQDDIDPKEIALKAHKIKKSKNKKEAEEFVNKSATLMGKFDITKNLTYDSGNNKTLIEIKLDNIPSSERTNLTIYQIIPKSVANSVDDITFISDGGGLRFVDDKDPVIGWYFNESGDNESIEYETDGDTEGGTIIITQEAILYNEGELVINYRESGCNPGETHLFDIDGLEDAMIYPTSAGELYKVCITHIDGETIYADDSGDLDLHIFNYSTNGNLSMYNMYDDYELDLSASPSDTEYWDMIIQADNPNGNYSCLGSINNDYNNTLFGDCGYTENRIWLHLGADYQAPTTDLSFPALAHTLKITLEAEDNIGGSGVNKTYYCIDETNTCTPSIEYTAPFTVTCPYEWGCVKYARYYSTDNEGNSESWVSYQLRLIDKGSACQADCTAKPSPDRYLKECRNLNGCFYYELDNDEGETTANACDFLARDSWVKLNATHDVQCPGGPIRETRFTSLPIDIEDTWCKTVLSVPFVALFEGETVIMKILTCQDPLEYDRPE